MPLPLLSPKQALMTSLRRRLRDRVRDQDMIIIDRDRQAGNEGGLEHRADRVAVRNFRAEGRAPPEKVALAWAAVGLAIEPIVLAGAPCARQTARRLALLTGEAPRHGSVASGGQADDGRREQFVDVRGADGALVIAAAA